MRGILRLASADAKSCRLLLSTREIRKPLPCVYKFLTCHAPLGCVHPNRMDMLQFARVLSSTAITGPSIPSPIESMNSANETIVHKDNSYAKGSSSTFEGNLNKLLEGDVGSWMHEDRLMAQNVLKDILSRRPEEKNDLSIMCSNATQLLIRWIRENSAQKQSIGSDDTVPVGTLLQQSSNRQLPDDKTESQGIVNLPHLIDPSPISNVGDESVNEPNDSTESHEMLMPLIRVLYRWKRYLESPKAYGNRKGSYGNMKDEVKLSESSGQAVQLFQTFFESNLLSMPHMDETGQTLLSDKAFSMIFIILALEIANNPASARLCLSNADLILQQFIISFNTSHIYVWNSYLKVLAESSKFIKDSPEKAEHLVLRQELSTTNSLHAVSENVPTKLLSFNPNARSYAIVLDAWANSRRSDSSERAMLLLEAIRLKDRSALNNVCYTACIRALFQAGHGQKAEDLLWTMHEEFIQGDGESTLVRPDHFTFLAVIDGWSKSGQPERAKALMERMISLQQNNPLYSDCLYPTAEIFTTVMSAYARHQKNSGPLVEDMLLQMEQSYLLRTDVGSQADNSKLCKPSHVTYSVAILAWAKTEYPDAPERAEAIFHRLKEYGDEDPDLMPNKITYNSLIQAWANSKRDDGPEKAMAILRRMKESQDYRAAPDTITYNMVIAAFAKKGMVREAHDLLDQFIQVSSQNDVNTNLVEERAAHPNAGSFATVIHGYYQNHTRDSDSGKRAHELLVQMEQWLEQKSGRLSRTYMNHTTSEVYVHTIYALSFSNLIEEADSVLWEMVKRYEVFNGQPHIVIRPDIHICNAVLATWSYSNEPCAPDRAQRIWRWLDEQNAAGNKLRIRPTGKTIKHIIEIWGKSKSSTANQEIKEFCDEVKIKYPDLLKKLWLQPLLKHYSQNNEIVEL